MGHAGDRRPPRENDGAQRPPRENDGAQRPPGENDGAQRPVDAGPTGARRAPLSRELACAARAIEALVAGRSLPEALDEALAAESSSEPLPVASHAAIRDLAYRSCRELGLVRELARGLNAREPAPALAALQWVALAQLVESVRADAVLVDQAVRAAHALPGGAPVAGFLNATLRRFVRERDERLQAARSKPEARWNHPDWWIDRLRRAWPERWQQILEVGNGAPPMTLRVNRRQTSATEYLSRLHEQGIAARCLGDQAIVLDAAVPVGTLPGWHDGVVTVQDAAAQLAALFLAPRDGERLLDACAAPGGKATHLLELADVELTALDIDVARLRSVRENLERLGFAGGDAGKRGAAVASRAANANPATDPAPLFAPTRPPILIAGDAARPSDWWDGRPFDRILVDAPCTASGIVRRHPDVRWLRRRSDLATLPRRQSEILQTLWSVLGTGGKLLYTTCSVFPEEGEGVITRFLEKHRDASRLPLQWRFDGRTPEPVATLLPVATATRDHDGFFFALLEKRP
ncbi:MAG: 16S rRNA (cytosine(967)-C(5))-methyltransferase RsmB [Burkholderiaceae bacterium]|nr:16S rRNA (cytosine(967)-C(5))-methyltransferase RsmB [Burkholderiaceae bacterium]